MINPYWYDGAVYVDDNYANSNDSWFCFFFFFEQNINIRGSYISHYGRGATILGTRLAI